MLPKIVLTDVDGVLTDGGMYYDETGNEWKKFSNSDGIGVLLCKAMGVKVAFITGEKTEIVARRAKKLKIEYLIQGSSDKSEDAGELCKKLNLKLTEAAYIGDDLIDLSLLNKVKFSAAPFNAPEYIKKNVDFVTRKKGGEGAFREFVEELLIRENKLKSAIERVLKSFYGSKSK